MITKTLALIFAVFCVSTTHAAGKEDPAKAKELFELLSVSLGDTCKKSVCVVTAEEAMCDQTGDQTVCTVRGEKGEPKKRDGDEAKKLMQAMLGYDVELLPDGAKMSFRSPQLVTCTRDKKHRPTAYTCKARSLVLKSPHGN